jgi:PIF1 helicase.
LKISPRRAEGNDFDDEIAQELGYDFIALQHQVTQLIPQLPPEQSHVFHQVLSKIESGNGALFFHDAPGGTGKTFLLILLSMSVRKDQEIAVAVASSSIATTLLTGGRTANSILK